MDTQYAFVGFLRTIGILLLVTFLSYIGVADNLTFLNPVSASLVAGLAMALEHLIESSTGRALFGAVKA